LLQETIKSTDKEMNATGVRGLIAEPGMTPNHGAAQFGPS
jgi:hypothetical protein